MNRSSRIASRGEPGGAAGPAAAVTAGPNSGSIGGRRIRTHTMHHNPANGIDRGWN